MHTTTMTTNRLIKTEAIRLLIFFLDTGCEGIYQISQQKSNGEGYQNIAQISQKPDESKQNSGRD